jgi:hypothetical protein
MQGVLVFASSAARAAAITSPQEGQYSYLKDTNSTEYYDGAAWIAAPIGDITGVTAGTGISGGGTSGTVTVTNSMATAIDAKGDLIAGTAADTFDRLAVGTNGQTLVADSTASTGLKWATPAVASSGLTFIQRSTFSNVANTGTTFDGIFSSTYSSYMVIIENFYAGTSTDDMYVVARIGATSHTTQYNNASIVTNNTTTSIVTVLNAATNSFLLADQSGTSTEPTRGSLNIPFAGAAGGAMTISGQLSNNNASRYYNFNGTLYPSYTYTGLQFSSSSSNITGTISVYGLAKS